MNDKRKVEDKRKPVKVYIQSSYLKKLENINSVSRSEHINIALKKYLSEKEEN